MFQPFSEQLSSMLSRFVKFIFQFRTHNFEISESQLTPPPPVGGPDSMSSRSEAQSYHISPPYLPT